MDVNEEWSGDQWKVERKGGEGEKGSKKKEEKKNEESGGRIQRLNKGDGGKED